MQFRGDLQNYLSRDENYPFLKVSGCERVGNGTCHPESRCPIYCIKGCQLSQGLAASRSVMLSMPCEVSIARDFGEQ